MPSVIYRSRTLGQSFLDSSEVALGMVMSCERSDQHCMVLSASLMHESFFFLAVRCFKSLIFLPLLYNPYPPPSRNCPRTLHLGMNCPPCAPCPRGRVWPRMASPTPKAGWWDHRDGQRFSCRSHREDWLNTDRRCIIICHGNRDMLHSLVISWKCKI